MYKYALVTHSLVIQALHVIVSKNTYVSFCVCCCLNNLHDALHLLLFHSNARLPHWMLSIHEIFLYICYSLCFVFRIFNYLSFQYLWYLRMYGFVQSEDYECTCTLNRLYRACYKFVVFLKNFQNDDYFIVFLVIKLIWAKSIL